MAKLAAAVITVGITIWFLNISAIYCIPQGCLGSGSDCFGSEPPKENVEASVTELLQSSNDGKFNTSVILVSADCSEDNCSGESLPRLELRRDAKRSIYPVMFIIQPAEADEGQASGRNFETPRVKRFPKKCNDSIQPINHAFLKCWAWPNFLSCEVNCTYGYALKEGGKILAKTTRKCRESDPFWSPPTFPVCEPYIHCKTYLVNPGNLSCKGSMVTPPYCNITCFAESEYPEIPMKRYECTDDKYGEKLPQCASLDKSVPLIGRPQGF